MKYGQKLVEQSVPKWSLHNIDYNSLKHEIKVHTTRDQARAIVIPGQEDKSLCRFENRLYAELCKQHRRVGLFVTTKSGELMRKLDHIAEVVQRIVAQNNEEGTTVRRQRRLIRYERELLEAGGDIAALQRFVNAQVEAFRKILKKYRKWTGSTALGARFRTNVLRDPNSFTRNNFDDLQTRYVTILSDLEGAARFDSEDSSAPTSPTQPTRHQPQSPWPSEPAPLDTSRQIRYWNEYDDGSECGNDDDEYVIYINPEGEDDDWTLPGFAHLTNMLTLPYDKARAWFSGRSTIQREQKRYDSDTDVDVEQRALLLPGSGGGGGGCATDTDDLSGDDDAPSSSSSTYGTLWFARQQHRRARERRHHAQRRDRVLAWAARGSFAAALVLVVVEALMLGTGRPEVDAAVAVAAVASLFFAGGGLWAGVWVRERESEEDMFLERGPSPEGKLMSWAIFITALTLNVFVLGVVGSNLGEYMRLWWSSAERLVR